MALLADAVKIGAGAAIGGPVGAGVAAGGVLLSEAQAAQQPVSAPMPNASPPPPATPATQAPLAAVGSNAAAGGVTAPSEQPPTMTVTTGENNPNIKPTGTLGGSDTDSDTPSPWGKALTNFGDHLKSSTHTSGYSTIFGLTPKMQAPDLSLKAPGAANFAPPPQVQGPTTPPPMVSDRRAKQGIAQAQRQVRSFLDALARSK